MRFSIYFLMSIVLSVMTFTTHAAACRTGKCKPPDVCCGGMGGIKYCDTSAGRFVCKNGFYSSCYCKRHAIMDLQHIQGCCLWQGGIFKVDPHGIVICNDGGTSEVCTMQVFEGPVATFGNN